MRELPAKPGVYVMRDRSGKVIYVGKAKSLRNRVRNYFQWYDRAIPSVQKKLIRTRLKPCHVLGKSSGSFRELVNWKKVQLHEILSDQLVALISGIIFRSFVSIDEYTFHIMKVVGVRCVFEHYP